MAIADERAGTRGLINRAEVREHPALLLLYVVALGTPALALSEAPLWLSAVGWAGAICLGLLLLRLVLVGFTGYERLVGLRIIRRKGQDPLGVSSGAASPKFPVFQSDTMNMGPGV